MNLAKKIFILVVMSVISFSASADTNNLMVDFKSVKEKRIKMTPFFKLTKGSQKNEITNKEKEIEKIIVNILKSKSVKDIAGIEGKNKLNQEMKLAINSILSKSNIDHIYYRSFQIN